MRWFVLSLYGSTGALILVLLIGLVISEIRRRLRWKDAVGGSYKRPL